MLYCMIHSIYDVNAFRTCFYYVLNARIPLMTVYVIQFDLKLSQKLKEKLEELEFSLSNPPYTLFQGKKKGVTCTLYTSGKLTVQGKEMKEFIEYHLEPDILGNFSYGYENLNLDLRPRMGVDESGKGDFFGPLCIAGVFAEGKGVQDLASLGVKDSKQLQESSILKIAKNIRKEFLHHIVKISPEKYNVLYQKFGNLNLLLAWGHATVIDHLSEKSKCETAIIDQFAAEHVVITALQRKKKKILLEQRPRAEADLVVAAASILARASFVEGLKQLEESIGIQLPKGASKATIDVGKKMVQKHGKEILRLYSKEHFKTTVEILK